MMPVRILVACLFAFQSLLSPALPCAHGADAAPERAAAHAMNHDASEHASHGSAHQSDRESVPHNQGMPCAVSGQCTAPARMTGQTLLATIVHPHVAVPDTEATTLASVSFSPKTPPPKV